MRRIGGVMRVGILAVCVGWFAVGACRKPPSPTARSPEAGRPASALAVAPSEPQTAEACRSCNGAFGVHGLAEKPSCNCRTRDVGKRCTGKDDCEADCIADLGDREVTDPGPPPRGHHLGRCAEFRTTFGCHTFLPPHGSTPTPVRLDQPLEQLCVD